VNNQGRGAAPVWQTEEEAAMLCKDCLSFSFGYCYTQEAETDGEHSTCWVSTWLIESSDDLVRRYPCLAPDRLRPLSSLYRVPSDKIEGSPYL
jgi:hypothetical protein